MIFNGCRGQQFLNTMELTGAFLLHFAWSLYLVAPLLIFFVLLILFLGQVVGRLEKWAPFDALYWSLVTATTVGYGDIRPLRKWSRMLAIAIALNGLILTGIIIAIAINTVTYTIEHLIDPAVIQRMREQFY